jgi:hypothetical protein
LLTLKARWRDGTTHLRLDPIELMERFAAQIPKPRINLVLYAGVLAPNAKLRAEVVLHARPAALPDPPATETQTRADERETWSELMRITFQLDVLACPRCGGRLRHIATVLDVRVARRILEHLVLPARAPPELPPRDPPPFWPAVDEAAPQGGSRSSGRSTGRRQCRRAQVRPRGARCGVFFKDTVCVGRLQAPPFGPSGLRRAIADFAEDAS